MGVIYELVNRLILTCSTVADTLRSGLGWSGAALLLLTATISGHLAGSPSHRVMSVFQVLDFSSSVLQVGLLAVLFLFSRILRISWEGLPVGIALGLGIVGSAELSAAGLFSVLGPRHHIAVDVLRLASFHACVLVWLGYLFFPKREPRFAGKILRKSQLDSWDMELQRLELRGIAEP